MRRWITFRNSMAAAAIVFIFSGFLEEFGITTPRPVMSGTYLSGFGFLLIIMLALTDTRGKEK